MGGAGDPPPAAGERMIVKDGTGFRVQGPITMGNVVSLLDEGRRLSPTAR